MSYDESEDLAYKPFAEDNDYLSESNVAHGFASSSVPSKHSNPQLVLSLSEPNSAVQGTTDEGGKHNHSAPDISIVRHTAGLHPLKSALATQNDTVLYDLGVTRPHLSRIINERTLINDKSSELEDSLTIQTPLASDKEIEVIIHEVASKDSLAGVSLKYGISLANLRRANQLWATDSIHLRDVLYIPIEQALRAREFMPESQLIYLTNESQEPGASIHVLPNHISPFTEESVESSSTNPLIPIRRMPSSQLTFFPPSSNKNLESNLNGHCQDAPTHIHSDSHKSLPGSNSRYTSYPASNSLTSILTALPIAASTRDELITRLSFDSVSSSFSDRSRTNSDEDIGHELDDVAKYKSSHIRTTVCEDVDEMSMPTPKASQHPLHSEMLPKQQASRITSSSSLPKNSYVRSLSSASSLRFYVSQAYDSSSVRTYQMEPSPDMQLPTFRSHTVGRSSGRRAQDKAATDSQTSSR